ncbi:MAG TPA: toll/interleukin-1 receptor domain-containing protein, partial [Nocardioides sp.]|nr:toll/interleukin-1 receptor domain-containing protein [Nocardioides sp.]
MSRVFVSCAYRDRAIGAQVEAAVRELGHEAFDDLDDLTRDEAAGRAWWDEIVARIESCQVYVALVSSAYAESQSCRLAAKHAEACSLRVVRLDLESGVSGCHPVIERAVPVPF